MGEQYRPYIVEQGKGYLGESYDQIVKDSTSAFQTLRLRGYSQEKATGMLAAVHPEEWKNFVENMKEN